MKTSEFIELRAAELHALVDKNRQAQSNPDLIGHIEGLLELATGEYDRSRESLSAVLHAAREFYGAEAHLLDKEKQAQIWSEMKSSIASFAILSTRCRRNGD
ncbi:hypothetical protein PQR71_10205 [Paraburkholderia fungorum]|uniref:hypothetical protein n=1 Tax=Paraburkholderia fungorum TaxID=134537 RepID=UPI0038BE17F5